MSKFIDPKAIIQLDVIDGNSGGEQSWVCRGGHEPNKNLITPNVALGPPIAAYLSTLVMKCWTPTQFRYEMWAQ